MSRKVKIILILGGIVLFGVNACLAAAAGSWGWVACFALLFALLASDLYGLLWPRSKDRA